MDIAQCARVVPPHPCDPEVPCDPIRSEDEECIRNLPTLCVERLKNPALPGEITRCKQGAFMNARVCTKEEPKHPCDPLPLCSTLEKKKRPCDVPALCLPRIKNPVKEPTQEPCIKEETS